ncbi:uncharacterized protein MELLADRAFT_112622 [Melampsora larici-populina 98AG31]|uniref:Uncharacterized protein n=1 Tax=Melampsora larici-populina (strain 98AG31 / pathotype 3-4-7) TaxID=747676 RepID=F4S726_MELLP|nr:uncharacterized protein MELLADRAFT_112622 [Melampsora larici-populina 98AG31]EGF99565.1 hypothetical protein MELLADRAFT_112622 [Melampsora larici-populina 98AG31]
MPKRNQGTSNDIVDVFVIDSDPEEDKNFKGDDVIFVEEVSTSNTSTSKPPKQTSTTTIPANKKRQTETTRQRNPILLCPRSKANEECSCCKIHVEDVIGPKTLHCHCGSKIKLPKGRVEAAVDHWKSRACKNHTERMEENKVLSSWVTVTKKKQLHNTLEANAVWKIWRHGEQASIHSSQCTNKVECRATTLHPICNKCEELKNMRRLSTYQKC